MKLCKLLPPSPLWSGIETRHVLFYFMCRDEHWIVLRFVTVCLFVHYDVLHTLLFAGKEWKKEMCFPQFLSTALSEGLS